MIDDSALGFMHVCVYNYNNMHVLYMHAHAVTINVG